MFQLAKEQADAKARPLRVKKMYVLAALLVEQYHEQTKLQSRTMGKNKSRAEVGVLWGRRQTREWSPVRVS